MFVIRSSKILIPVATLLVIAACASQTHEEAMQLFVEHTNMIVLGKKANIERFLKPRSGYALEGVQEVEPGIMEYSLVDKLILFVPVEKKCRIIVVVQKETGTMINWRYNSKPEYCTENR